MVWGEGGAVFYMTVVNRPEPWQVSLWILGFPLSVSFYCATLIHLSVTHAIWSYQLIQVFSIIRNTPTVAHHIDITLGLPHLFLLISYTLSLATFITFSASVAGSCPVPMVASHGFCTCSHLCVHRGKPPSHIWNDLLAVFMLWFCPALCWQDTNSY
jgi:hypothetical protein